MPVTAKLSKAFYQQLGHEVTDELVDYLNDVDVAYRSDLRDLNELNFARFDAKLEQLIAELRSTLREELAELRATFREELSNGLSKLRQELAELRATFREELSNGLSQLREELTGEQSRLREEIVGLEGRLRLEIRSTENRLLTWMFAAWATTIGTLITLLRLWG